MPIITVHAKFPAKFPTKILNSEIQEAAAKSMGEPHENFWVSSVKLDADWNHPPYITVLAKKGRDEKIKRRFAAAIANAAATHLETTPENVWIHYQELNPEDIWYGGNP